MIWPLVLALSVLAGCGTPTSFGATPRHASLLQSPQYDPAQRRFVNPVPTELGVKLSQLPGVVRRYRENEQAPRGALPVARRNAAIELGEGVFVTWLGHATVLLEIDRFTVLTDPVWSARASPFSFAGPKRHHPPPLALHELPRIDAVVISHDHYDHLDHATVEWLSLRGARFFVPRGVGAHFERWGVPRVYEFDWWDGVTLTRAGRTLELIATPARHFSGRGLSKRNRALWASWVIRTEQHAVFFGGDTGYFDGFAAIGEQFGPFDATLLPIGAYDEAWSAIHLNPAEALTVHRDLGNHGMLFPLHFGTFTLAAHGWGEPLHRLVEELAASASTTYALPLPGQRVNAHGPTLHQGWWQGL